MWLKLRLRRRRGLLVLEVHTHSTYGGEAQTEIKQEMGPGERETKKETLSGGTKRGRRRGCGGGGG